MIRRLFLVFFITGSFSVFSQNGELLDSEILSYRSNAMGMPLELIDHNQDAQYLLTVSRQENYELSRLYIDGNLETSWERYFRGGKLMSEKEFIGETSVDREFSGGRLVLERNSLNGIEEDRWEFTYYENSLSESVFYIDGEEEFRDHYVKNREGRLLRVDRVFSQGDDIKTAYSYSSITSYSEWFQYGMLSELFSFNQGILDTHEVWESGELTQRISWTKEGSGRMKLTEYPLEGWIIYELYDRMDRLVAKEEEGEDSEYTVEYKYQGENLSEMIERRRGERNHYFYNYIDGTLAEEKLERNGELLTKRIFESESIEIKETYRRGELLITVTYENDVPIETVNHLLTGGNF